MALYLDENFFNPRKNQLGMDVRVDQAGRVHVMVFNIAGEKVKDLLNQYENVGNYRVYWDGRNNWSAEVGNAVYFVVIEQPSGQMIRKVIVLK